MNKGQWYAWGFVFSVGFVLCFVSIDRIASLPIDDVSFAVYIGLNNFLGKLCLMGAVACFICGMLEEKHTK